MHQFIANATFQVKCDNSFGSGFSFLEDDIVVTNHHVIKCLLKHDNTRAIDFVTLICESGEEIKSEIIYFDEQNDLALLRLLAALPYGREVLQPADDFTPVRGKRLIFAGYPHGISDLLTSEAVVSCPLENGRFYLDGMVNGGNSGGPIVDAETGMVVGIITARRFFFSDESKALMREIDPILKHLSEVSLNVRAAIQGVSFGDLAGLFGHSIQTTIKMMNMNANSGIGIAFSITPAIEAIKKVNSA